jgi:hypothetical protein
MQDDGGKYHTAGQGGQPSDVADLLAEAGIKLPSYAPGQHNTTCPRCSAKRSKVHQRTKCLGVKIDADWRVLAL